MKDRENWKHIEKFPEYAVSSLGEVKRVESSPKSKAGTILKPYMKTNYPHVVLKGRDRKFHTALISRLVLETFFGESDRKVKHRDEDTTNNILSNLYYAPFIDKDGWKELNRLMNFWISNKDHKRLKILCRRENIRMADFIREAISNSLKKEK